MPKYRWWKHRTLLRSDRDRVENYVTHEEEDNIFREAAREAARQTENTGSFTREMVQDAFRRAEESFGMPPPLISPPPQIALQYVQDTIRDSLAHYIDEPMTNDCRQAMAETVQSCFESLRERGIIRRGVVTESDDHNIRADLRINNSDIPITIGLNNDRYN